MQLKFCQNPSQLCCQIAPIEIAFRATYHTKQLKNNTPHLPVVCKLTVAFLLFQAKRSQKEHQKPCTCIVRLINIPQAKYFVRAGCCSKGWAQMSTCKSNSCALIFSMPVTRKSKYTLIKQANILLKQTLFSVKMFMYLHMYHGKQCCLWLLRNQDI